MHLGSLLLDNFRSYEALELDLSPGVTTLLGPNGSGKTNIVEAVRYLGSLSSHRVASDGPLIRQGAEKATIRGIVHRAGRAMGIEIVIASKGSNTARLNRSPVKPCEVAHILRTVVFSPEDLDLVKGEPSGRRAFLDELCAAISPTVMGDLADYDRIVRQKGALLKSLKGKAGPGSTLDVWNGKLADVGARILKARAEAIASLKPHAASAYADVTSGAADLSLSYDGTIDVDTALDRGGEDALREGMLQAIALVADKERERGVCLVGPHRDDLVVTIGGLTARGYASHGESWSAALALRLATYDLFTAEGGPDSGEDGEPVLMLDDVFAELDTRRRAALAERSRMARQVIVTAAVRSDVPETLGGMSYVVDGGKVTADG
jgi:DNA replication and repair protein RecF